MNSESLFDTRDDGGISALLIFGTSSERGVIYRIRLIDIGFNSSICAKKENISSEKSQSAFFILIR
jgi:hypothetical protein